MKIKYWLYLAISIASVKIYATPPQVNLKFIFAIDNSNIDESQYSKIARQETHILNQYFVNEDQQPIFKFKLKNYIDNKTFKNMNCKLSEQLNKKLEITSEKIKNEFNQCFKNSNGIYIFIYDAYNAESGQTDTTSWGFNNNNQPFILLDWKRLKYHQQAALPHEMGHVFGLLHICVKKAKRWDSTNIMASAGNCDGSGGKRNLGFNNTQVDIIKNKFNQMELQ